MISSKAIKVCYTVLKITAGQWSLIVTTAFVTAEKLHGMVTMTANTWRQQQLLTATISIFATSFKIIFAILYHRQFKYTKGILEYLGILEVVCNNVRNLRNLKNHRNLQFRNHGFKFVYF